MPAGLDLACHAWAGTALLCGSAEGQLLAVDAAGTASVCDNAVQQPQPAQQAACEGARPGRPHAAACSQGAAGLARAGASPLASLAEVDPAGVACLAVAGGLLVAACTRQRRPLLRCAARQLLAKFSVCWSLLWIRHARLMLPF